MLVAFLRCTAFIAFLYIVSFSLTCLLLLLNVVNETRFLIQLSFN
jgi:hypothetical protein